jgi:uncharacterized protein YkwD
MITSNTKAIGLAALLLVANANPNSNLPGSLQLLPQAPVPDIATSSDYNAAYNILALQAHNTYRRAHQVCDMVFSAEAAAAAQDWADRMNSEG